MLERQTEDGWMDCQHPCRFRGECGKIGKDCGNWGCGLRRIVSKYPLFAVLRVMSNFEDFSKGCREADELRREIEERVARNFRDGMDYPENHIG